MTPNRSIDIQLQERVLEAEGKRVRLIFYWDETPEEAQRQLAVLVVVDDPVENWLTESSRLLKKFDDFPVPIAVVNVFGEAEFEQAKEVPGTLPFRAVTSGTRVYDRSNVRTQRSGL